MKPGDKKGDGDKKDAKSTTRDKKRPQGLGPRTQKGLVTGLRNDDEVYSTTRESDKTSFPAELRVAPGEAEWDNKTKAVLRRNDPRQPQIDKLRQRHLPMPNDENPTGETQLRCLAPSPW